MEKDIPNKTESEKDIVYGIYFNKSRRFSIKYVMTSITYSFISLSHYIRNQFQKKIKSSQKILFLTNSKEIIIEELKNNLVGLELIKQNVLDKGSFFKRMNSSSKIHYNNIISIPFFKICPDENSFYRAVALNFIANYRNFLEKNTNLKKIILYDEYSLPSWTLIAAKKYFNKHTVFAIQHANIPSNHKEYIEFIKTGSKFLPDHILTYCEEEKNNLLNIIEKRNETKITAIGCSRFDSLNEKYDIDELREKFGFESKNHGRNIDKEIKRKKIILWMTQTHVLTDEENNLNCKKMFETFSNIKKESDNVSFIIKFHPGEIQKNTIYDKFNKEFNNIAKIFRGKENSYDLIRASDAVIIKDSSTFMMASLLGKEIGILNLLENRQYYKEYHFPIIIRNNSDLISFIEEVGTNKHKQIFNKFNKKITEKYFKNFGHATRKIVEYIKKN